MRTAVRNSAIIHFCPTYRAEPQNFVILRLGSALRILGGDEQNLMARTTCLSSGCAQEAIGIVLVRATLLPGSPQATGSGAWVSPWKRFGERSLPVRFAHPDNKLSGPSNFRCLQVHEERRRAAKLIFFQRSPEPESKDPATPCGSSVEASKMILRARPVAADCSGEERQSGLRKVSPLRRGDLTANGAGSFDSGSGDLIGKTNFYARLRSS